MLCGRTLKSIIDYLACSLNDHEGSELKRIARKNCDYDPDADGVPDGPDFEYEECEGELNHIRWSEVFLTSTLNDAFRILHMERPDLFTDRVTYTLMAGCKVQSLKDPCLKFAGGLRNAKGNCDETPVLKLSESQARSTERLAGLFCGGSTSDEDYCVTGYTFNPENPNEFTVTPSPPEGVETKVTFNAVKKAPCFNWDEDSELEIAECLLDDYEPWFIQYALFAAHMTDRESETSLSVAKDHWDKGFKLIADGKQADYAFYHPDLYLVGPIAGGTGERIILQP